MLPSVPQLELGVEGSKSDLLPVEEVGFYSSPSWSGGGRSHCCSRGFCSLGCAKSCFSLLCGHVLTEEVETTSERLGEEGTLKSRFGFAFFFFRAIGKISSFNSG